MGVYNRNRKSALQQAIVVQIKISIALTDLLIKLQNITINRFTLRREGVWGVVIEMGVATHFSHVQNLIKSNNKIPHYARDYKKEYLFIRGLNKEFKYFINKLDNLNNGLFESNISNKIKYIMKRFLRGQEKGKLKDISNLMLPRYDVDNLIFINERFRIYKIRWDFFNPSDDSDDEVDDSVDIDDSDDSDVEVGIDDSDDEDNEYDGKNVYPGFKEIYDIFNLFFSKIKYKSCDSDSDSDSDSVIEIEFVLPDSDSE